MKATPNEIEQRLGLPENSLTVSEEAGVYSFFPELTSEQQRVAIAMLNGLDTSDSPDYLGFDNALLDPAQGLNLFLFVRSMSDQYPAPVGSAYNDLSRAIAKGVTLQLANVRSTNLAAFQSCVDNLFGALAFVGQSFSLQQTAQMRSLLDSYGFSSIVFPLGG
jgi:hypothetical protein